MAKDSVVVTTKLLDEIPLALEEFRRRLRQVKDLQEQAGESFLKFAVGYAELYRDVARQLGRIYELETKLNLSHRAGTRLRTIAANVDRLTPIQDRVPLALEPLYELTLALKEDPAYVQTCIDAGVLSPESTKADILKVREATKASAKSEVERLRNIDNPTQEQRQRLEELAGMNRQPAAAKRSKRRRGRDVEAVMVALRDWFERVNPDHTAFHSLAEVPLFIDNQAYGSTIIVERFVMTTVKPYQADDGQWHVSIRSPKTLVTSTLSVADAKIPPNIWEAIHAATTATAEKK